MIKNSKNLREIKKKFPKVKIISNFEDFLKLNLLGVIVSVDTNSHYEIASKCLKNNFNIFLEKPSTNSVKKLTKLKKLASSKKLFYNEWLYLLI